jgi:hypothetical protein
MKNIFAIQRKALSSAGFAKVDFAKILFSKNLNTKILRTKRLAGQVSHWADRHCLDNDRAIEFWAQGQMSHESCGKLGIQVQRNRRYAP